MNDQILTLSTPNILSENSTSGEKSFPPNICPLEVYDGLKRIWTLSIIVVCIFKLYLI